MGTIMKTAIQLAIGVIFVKGLVEEKLEEQMLQTVTIQNNIERMHALNRRMKNDI